jgi:hypothetical protein
MKAAQQVDDSYATHRHALASIRGGRHPGTGAWSHQNFCWLLSTHGPLGSCEAAEAIGMSINVFRHRGTTAEAALSRGRADAAAPAADRGRAGTA